MKKNKYLDELGRKAKVASESVAKLKEEKKNKILNDYIQEIKKNKKKILNANALDIKRAKINKIKKLFLKNALQ